MVEPGNRPAPGSSFMYWSLCMCVRWAGMGDFIIWWLVGSSLTNLTSLAVSSIHIQMSSVQCDGL